MLKYVMKRLLLMIPVLLGVSFVVFLLMYISPGDPAKMILGEMAEPEEIEDEIERVLTPKILTGKKVLVSAGAITCPSCVSPIPATCTCPGT